MRSRSLTTFAALLTGLAATAADFDVPMETNYMLLGMAILQFVVVLILIGIIRNVGTSRNLTEKRSNGSDKAGLLLVMLSISQGSFATTPGIVLMTSTNLFWWMLVLNLLLFGLVLSLLVSVKGLTRKLIGPEEAIADAEQEATPDFAETLLQKLTRSVDVEHEEDVLMHHEYDGIRELDNVLPPWWLWLFYGSIIWGVIFVFNVHVIGIWPDQETAYKEEMAQAKEDVAAYLAQFSDLVDETNVEFLTDETTLSSGASIFGTLCVACHGANGEGNNVGPNLTDKYWIHGGGIIEVFTTIKYGVPEKGMISWKSQLKPNEMQAVSSYILSLQGTDPPNAKPPQGDLWTPESEAAPSESADSTAAPIAEPATIDVVAAR